jgi:hypothetical protein
MAKPYAELVAQAENAVAGVKDAELRRVAFERILNDLLGGGSEGQSGKPAAEARASKHKPAKPTESVPSSVEKQAAPH